MSEHPLTGLIPGFHHPSYHAGIIIAFAEVVGAGCKKLALSDTYDETMARALHKATLYAAKKYNVKVMVEKELIKTKLFPEDIAEGKTVYLIAHDEKVLEEYLELKRLKEDSERQGRPAALEEQIARRFGALLSYDEATITRLLNRIN